MKIYPVSLLGLAIVMSIHLPVHAEEFRIDFGTVFNVVSNIVNPPYRAAQEQADAAVAKERARQAADIAKIKSELEASKNADKAAPVVTKWGVERMNCTPDAVAINGLTTDTVCIKPNEKIGAGFYTYDAARGQLVRTMTQNATTNTAKPRRERGF